ncbi:MAG: FAD-dependent oxidoreductase [Patescibacteria group bacterium]
MYDLIIIGSGPAGMTAGLYAVRREMKTLIIGKEVGGQMVWASDVENYPGFEKIPAFELITKFKDQTLHSGVEMKDDEVKRVEQTTEGTFLLHTNKETFEAKTVIVAMGLSPRRLAVDGEMEFTGRGVSYCANCDGPFFRQKTVAVIGGGNSALDAAEVLSKIASQVYLVHHGPSFKAFDALVAEVKSHTNIEICLNSELKQIAGKDNVEKIVVRDVLTNKEREIALDGVFIEVGRIASTDLVAEFVDRNEKNQIIANSKTQTKTPGLFAAGDVTDCEFKQITIAMGQATVAALSAYQYLQLKSGQSFVAKNY